MLMRFLEEGQVSRVSILALPLFNLALHARQICREPEPFAIAEPDVVVGVAFDKFDAFTFETGVKFFESPVKEPWEEKKGWPLIESLEVL